MGKKSAREKMPRVETAREKKNRTPWHAVLDLTVVSYESPEKKKI